MDVQTIVDDWRVNAERHLDRNFAFLRSLKMKDDRAVDRVFIYFNNGGQIQGGYLVLLILAVLFDIGVFSGGHRAMRKK